MMYKDCMLRQITQKMEIYSIKKVNYTACISQLRETTPDTLIPKCTYISGNGKKSHFTLRNITEHCHFTEIVNSFL